MSPERRRQALFAVLALVAVVAGWQYLGASAAEAPAVVAARRAAAAPLVPRPPVMVGVAALESPRRGPAEGGRNPFVFGARSVVAPVGSRPLRPSRPDAAAPPPAFAPAGPPPLPPIPLKFIGLVEGTTSAMRIAVLSDSKGLVVHGGEGTIIDGRYRILAIGPESVDIAYADGRGRQSLRLSGQ